MPQPASSPKPPAVGERWAHSPEAMITTRALIHWSLTGTNPHPVRRRWMPVLARVPSDKWSIAAMAELYLLHFRANRPFAVDLMAEQNPLPYHCAYSITNELLTLLPGPFLLFDCITRKFLPWKSEISHPLPLSPNRRTKHISSPFHTKPLWVGEPGVMQPVSCFTVRKSGAITLSTYF